MKSIAVILVVLAILAPRDAAAGVRVELAAESLVLGSGIEPLDLPMGVSGRVVSESHVRGDTWFMAGVGYGALWSDEQTFDAGEPDLRDRGSSGSSGALRHWDLFVGPCWRSPEASSSSYGEMLVGVTMEGRDELEGSLLVSFAAGYSWRIASGIDLVLSAGQRVHLSTAEGRTNLSLALRR